MKSSAKQGDAALRSRRLTWRGLAWRSVPAVAPPTQFKGHHATNMHPPNCLHIALLMQSNAALIS